MPNGTSLVSFNNINMYLSIDNRNGLILNKELPTDFLIKALEICLFNNNSKFGKDNLTKKWYGYRCSNSC